MRTDRDRIWNRARSLDQDGNELGAGDRALAAAILAHDLVMNGGVLHALQGMSPSERREAAAGFRFFALPALAELFEMEVPDDELDDDDEELDGELDEREAELNERYWACVANDRALRMIFEQRFAQDPHLFAKIQEPDLCVIIP